MTLDIKAVLDPGTYGGVYPQVRGSHFVCEDARNRWFSCGHAASGRHEQGGPIDPNPFCYVFACATVITAEGDGMADFRDVPHLRVGDVIEMKGYGLFTLQYHGYVEGQPNRYLDRYNLTLVPVVKRRKPTVTKHSCMGCDTLIATSKTLCAACAEDAGYGHRAR